MAENSFNKKNDGYGEIRVTKDGTYLGRYQLGKAILKDAGWIAGDSKTGFTWTDKARQAGVNSDRDFLNQPKAQEMAMTDALAVIEKEAKVVPEGRDFSLSSLIGTTFQGREIEGKQPSITVTAAGLQAAIHRQGAKAVRNFFCQSARAQQ